MMLVRHAVRMQSRVEKFLAHLDRLSGGVEPLFFPVKSTKPGLPGVTTVAYRNLPDEKRRLSGGHRSAA